VSRLPAVTPKGVVGRPSEASAAVGEAMLEQIILDLEKLLVKAEMEDWPTLL
jgi:creatinine amidohydrolase